MGRQGLENSKSVPRLTEPSVPYSNASAPPVDHGDDDGGSGRDYGSLEGGGEGSVRRTADEPPASPFIRRGDVSKGVRGAAPVHRGSQVAVSLGRGAGERGGGRGSGAIENSPGSPQAME